MRTSARSEVTNVGVGTCAAPSPWQLPCDLVPGHSDRHHIRVNRVDVRWEEPPALPDDVADLASWRLERVQVTSADPRRRQSR